MSNSENIRCGVVGVGYLGQHHARIYSALPGVSLVGIFEVDDARAAEICAKCQCPRFHSIEELGRACDAVSVVVPTDKHAQVAVPLLEAGCHLLIEKPLCTSLEEAGKILTAANVAKRIVQVGHIEHYNPVMRFLESAVNDPRYLTADRLAPFNPRGTEVGVVLDLMIHDIGIVLQLVKAPVERIDAVGVNIISPHEDIANARLTFANGAVANLNTSRVSSKKVRELRVFQPGAYLSLDFMNQSGHLLRMDGDTIFDIKREEIPVEKGEPLALELASFVQCVRDHAAPKVGTELGKSALEVAIRITDLIRQQNARKQTL
ncbi:MAG: Gfo/Idh/MocA family oxidoreductase [Puniceicoccales bacterium]|jgi:predicted dehydrogenase|nr:Gfo/Idh/MocA family oxidoreductase [Puniceicoccales bacterium]